MEKRTMVMAVVLSALLVESAVFTAAHQLLHRMSWSRPFVAALLAATTQDLSGNGEEFLKAVSQGRDADVNGLLDEKPYVAFAHEGHSISALMLALYGQRPAVAQSILGWRHDDLSIFEAAAFGQDEVLPSLLTSTPGLAKEYGPDGFAALHLSSYLGHRSSMEHLIGAGANIDAYSRNKFHACPLQSATVASQLEAARVLLTKGANANCRGDGGYSPVHQAAGSGQLELARLLLQHKADPSAKGDDGKGPWDVAVEGKRGAILGLLKREVK
jgi:ankyrin repeat protein